MKAILGQKVGMTQAWDDHGRLVAATVIFAEPNTVLASSSERVTLGAKTRGKTAKAQQHFAKKIGSKHGIRVKEFATLETESDSVSVGQFQVGDFLAISGRTKGKGFAGTIKRHNFHRGPVTHGSDNIRRPGSIGAQRPQRVPKGQKMAGHMGNKNLTVRGNKVLSVDADNNLLIVSVAVPGPNKAHVVIRSLA
jgi:large subunit ribosomal protein L3